MITTTTNSVEGRDIGQYLGLVTGEAIMGANIFRDFMAGITDYDWWQIKNLREQT